MLYFGDEVLIKSLGLGDLERDLRDGFGDFLRSGDFSCRDFSVRKLKLLAGSCTELHLDVLSLGGDAKRPIGLSSIHLSERGDLDRDLLLGDLDLERLFFFSLWRAIIYPMPWCILC